MPNIISLPKIGVNMTDAVIVKWLVKEGDTVKEEDHILDAETDKAVQEICATKSGIVAKLLVKEGESVSCQQPLAVLIEPGEKFDEETLIEPDEKSSGGLAEVSEETIRPKVFDETNPNKNQEKAKKINITPLARKMAKDLGLDITKISPSKYGERITKDDIVVYQKGIEAATIPAADNNFSSILDGNEIKDIIPYTGTRKVIGERMLESSNTKPWAALTLHAVADMIIKWRNELKEEGKSVSYNDILVLITAKALLEYPVINSRLVGNEIQILKNINIGVAIDNEKGLIVPVINNADKKSLIDINKDINNKLEGIKSGKFTKEYINGGTFTITNLGMFEIESFIPIINPPECCILAVGSITSEPIAEEGINTIVIKSRMQLTLVFDHRIVDGAPAAKFLQRIKHLIECPQVLL